MKWFIRYFFRTLRLVLTPFVLLWDKLTSPAGIQRSPEAQQAMDERTKNLFLYQFNSCPFCIKVRRQIKRQSLKIETRDTLHNPNYRQELLTEGGEIKVPCLKIVNAQGEASWMYESDIIIDYLQKNFS